MLGRRYVPTSYLQEQLANNIRRVQQLAELQTRMALQDLNNHELINQMAHLQSENQLLKKRLYARQAPPNRLELPGERAIDRASDYLYHKKHLKPRNLSHTCIDSLSKQPRSWIDKTCDCSKQHRHCKSIYENNPTCKMYQYTPDESIKLTKNVYVDPNEQKIKQNLQFASPPRNKRTVPEITFKKEQSDNRYQMNRTDNFPSKVQEFRSHSAHKRFEECSLSDSKLLQSNMLQRWNSEAQMNLPPETMSKMHHSHQKRKTFLSVVSHSSICKNK